MARLSVFGVVSFDHGLDLSTSIVMVRQSGYLNHYTATQIDMDWPTFFGTLLGSGALVGAATYILRKYFDAKIKEVQDRTSARITEATRRQAAIFDEQFGVAKLLLALVYRARNTAREIDENPEHLDRKALREQLAELTNQHDELEQILFKERAVMPQEGFRIAHLMKHTVSRFVEVADEIRRSRRSPKGDADALLHELHSKYQEINARYKELTTFIQSHLDSNNTAI